MARFSVVTINFNNKAGLEKTVSSVAAQEFSEFQFIVIDGASTDGAEEVQRKYQDQFAHWVCEPDNGIYDAMNKGLRLATGDYVCFLNSGDYFTDPKVLWRVNEAIEKTNELELYYGNVVLVNETGPTGFLNFRNVDLSFHYTNMVCHQSIFARRALFEKYSDFRTDFRISGDYDWELRMFLNPSVRAHFLNFAVCNFTVGGLSMNRRDLLWKEKEAIKKIYFSKSTRLLMKFLKKSRIDRFLKRKWISMMIELTSRRKWSRIGLRGDFSKEV